MAMPIGRQNLLPQVVIHTKWFLKQSAWDIGQRYLQVSKLAMGHTIVPFCKKSHLSISEYVNKNLMTCLYFDFFLLSKWFNTLMGFFRKWGKCSVPIKVEKILKGSLDLILSPSTSGRIQIMGLSCKGRSLLVFVNKLLKTKSLLISPSNVLLSYHK